MNRSNYRIAILLLGIMPGIYSLWRVFFFPSGEWVVENRREPFHCRRWVIARSSKSGVWKTLCADDRQSFFSSLLKSISDFGLNCKWKLGRVCQKNSRERGCELWSSILDLPPGLSLFIEEPDLPEGVPDSYRICRYQILPLRGAYRLSLGLPLDPNRASALELSSIPGVSRRLAKRIVAYRRKNGPFRSLEELLSVRGIGVRKLELLGRYLSLRGRSF